MDFVPVFIDCQSENLGSWWPYNFGHLSYKNKVKYFMLDDKDQDEKSSQSYFDLKQKWHLKKQSSFWIVNIVSIASNIQNRPHNSIFTKSTYINWGGPNGWLRLSAYFVHMCKAGPGSSQASGPRPQTGGTAPQAVTSCGCASHRRFFLIKCALEVCKLNSATNKCII